MKNILLIIIVFSFAQSAIANKHKKMNTGNAELAFLTNDSTYDLGAIPNGQQFEGQVEIKNSGTATLIINDIKCSSPKMSFKAPEHSVKPGKTGLITLTYDVDEANGSFMNKVIVFSNDKRSPSYIYITGSIVNSKSIYERPFVPRHKTYRTGHYYTQPL